MGTEQGSDIGAGSFESLMLSPVPEYPENGVDVSLALKTPVQL